MFSPRERLLNTGRSRIAPLTDKLSEVESFSKNYGFFFLRTILEKTSRSRRMPFVAVPGVIFDYYRFHVEVVRPYIIENELVQESELLEKTLLVHSLKGTPLSERDVSSTFKRFITDFDATLCNCTITDVRKAYATLMIRKHRRGDICKEMSVDEFKSWLSEMMNTSGDMLDKVYVANEDDDEMCERLGSFFGDRLDLISSNKEDIDDGGENKISLRNGTKFGRRKRINDDDGDDDDDDDDDDVEMDDGLDESGEEYLGHADEDTNSIIGELEEDVESRETSDESTLEDNSHVE